MVVAMYLRRGDRIMVQPLDAKPFEAVVKEHLGWGIVHGVINIVCEREDDETGFTYGIGYDTQVTVLNN